MSDPASPATPTSESHAAAFPYEAPPAAPTSEAPAAALPCEAPPAAPTSDAPAAAPTTEAAAAAPTYETACARIEAIIRRLDSGEAGLRETLELCQEGRRLVEFCASELEAVGRGLEELRLDELVARLESGRAAAPAA